MKKIGAVLSRAQMFLKYKRKFAMLGKNCRIIGDCVISGDGKIFLGENVTLKNTMLHAGTGAKITVGKNSVLINCGVSALSSVEIGEEALIGDRVALLDSDWHGTRREEFRKTRSIKIGNHVWICPQAAILKGVSVGDNAIIGFGAIVTHAVDANTIVAGNPAKKIGETNGYGFVRAPND